MFKFPSHVTILLVGFLTRTSAAMSVELLLSPHPNSTTSPEPPPDDLPTPTTTPNCTFQQLQPDDVIQLKGKLLITKSNNMTFPNSKTSVYEPSSGKCFSRSESLNREIFTACEKWGYNEDEYDVLPDGSVRLFGDVLEPGSFAVVDSELLTCAVDEEDYEGIGDDGNSTTGKVPRFDRYHWTIVVGQAGCVISIVALMAHLVSFCLVPAMRNLPGYNLASLSTAFLLGYLFGLIGQIPEVLGFFCVFCGILTQIFLLAAFFCMNTLAFDVWRTLKMATTKLCMSSQNAKRRQFIYYSIYSWGVPFLITAVSVALDYAPSSPKWIRPEFGKGDVCWMTNADAKKAFFIAPAFALFVANAVFFVLSAFIVKTNTMKCDGDEHRNNFVLYLRLGAMIGVTWLLGIVGMLVENPTVWLVHDIVNSLQGLLLFVLFTCSRKVFDHVREKLNLGVVPRTPKTSTSDLTGRTVISNNKS